MRKPRLTEPLARGFTYRKEKGDVQAFLHVSDTMLGESIIPTGQSSLEPCESDHVSILQMEKPSLGKSK